MALAVLGLLAGILPDLLEGSGEAGSSSSSTCAGNETIRMDWEAYHSLETMYHYLNRMGRKYEYLSTESIGKSFEGRDMRVAKICRGGCGNKPAMFVMGGIHAREWISPAAVMYLVKKLTDDLNTEDADLVDNLDWYVLPVANPDGYAFTQTSAVNRYWRKTRSTRPEDTRPCAVGVDANRNFGFHWRAGRGAISSRDPCDDEMYRGPSPFSEAEIANIERQFMKAKFNPYGFIIARKDRTEFFNDVHCCGQFLLVPWGYVNRRADDFPELAVSFDRARKALFEVNGAEYKIGTPGEIMFPVDGSSMDWAKGEAKIKYSMIMEVGRFMAAPGPDIMPIGEEVWAFHRSFARDIIQEFGNRT